ncbi:MAG: gp53-like domain-containing protein [Plesiomonas shigelloides]
MAIDFTAKYPGRFDPVSALYPQGKFKNRSAPNTEDGSYMERDWLNDWNGFFGALLKNANVTPNGTVDTATASQLYDALRLIMLGILPKRTFAVNDFIRIPDVPGGLIIQWGSSLCANIGITSVTFPTRFPTAALRISGVGTQVNTGVQAYASYSVMNESGFTWSAFTGQGGTAPSLATVAGSVGFSYIVVGY